MGFLINNNLSLVLAIDGIGGWKASEKSAVFGGTPVGNKVRWSLPGIKHVICEQNSRKVTGALGEKKGFWYVLVGPINHLGTKIKILKLFST